MRKLDFIGTVHLRSRLNLADGTEVRVTALEAEEKGKLPTPNAVVLLRF